MESANHNDYCEHGFALDENMSYQKNIKKVKMLHNSIAISSK